MVDVTRCWWCGTDPLYVQYHDEEWGRPVRDDRLLFEKVCLEGFQAGLSWLTILRKRENFRRAFRDFEIDRVARLTTRSVDRLLQDAGIVRHRGKIESTINNARRARELRDERESLADYFWSWKPPAASRPSRITREALMGMPTSPESVAMSRDLRKRGWTFVGPTTLYAFMQAMGLVNDHVEGCFAGSQIGSQKTGDGRATVDARLSNGMTAAPAGATLHHVPAGLPRRPRSTRRTRIP